MKKVFLNLFVNLRFNRALTIYTFHIIVRSRFNHDASHDLMTLTL